MAKNFLKSSIKNATFNILFQILFRVITFVTNAVVLRHISHDVVGIMNVRLLLLESTLLFLCREPFRRACLSDTTHHVWPRVINLIWISFPICLTMSVSLGYVWLYVLEVPGKEFANGYVLGVWAIILSCLCEIACEPLYLAAQAFLYVRLKVVMDTVHVLVRTLIFSVIVLRDPGNALLAFSLAQMSSTLVYSLGYYIFFGWKIYNQQKKLANDAGHDKGNSGPEDYRDEFPFNSLTDFLPHKLKDQPQVDKELTVLVWSFSKQGVWKQLLTEGERYLATVVSLLPFSHQGALDVVSSLAALPARLILRPLEDAAYFYFSQVIKRGESERRKSQTEGITKVDDEASREAAQVLSLLLCLTSSMGFVALSLGPPNSSFVLFVYGGTGLSESPLALTLLRANCLYLPLLAINGVSEAFCFATMSPQQIDKYNHVMALLSAAFLGVSYGLTSLFGAVGLVFANCGNMIARIAHSIGFIHARYSSSEIKNPLHSLKPGWIFLISLVASSFLCSMSERHLYEKNKLAHFVIGVCCLLISLATLLWEERQLVMFAVNKWREHKDKKKLH